MSKLSHLKNFDLFLSLFELALLGYSRYNKENFEFFVLLEFAGEGAWKGEGVRDGEGNGGGGGRGGRAGNRCRSRGVHCGGGRGRESEKWCTRAN